MFHSFFEKLRSDVFREHPEEIQRRNLDGMGQYLVISMLVGCLMTFGSILFGRQTTIADVIALAVYFGLGFLFHELLRRNGGTHATPVLYAMTAVVLLTAIATLGAFLYNLAAALLGGIEVTLAEDRD